MKRWPAVRNAAVLQAVGMDGAAYFNAPEEERLLMLAIADRAAELLDELRTDLAVKIVNSFGKAFK